MPSMDKDSIVNRQASKFADLLAKHQTEQTVKIDVNVDAKPGDITTKEVKRAVQEQVKRDIEQEPIKATQEISPSFKINTTAVRKELNEIKDKYDDLFEDAFKQYGKLKKQLKQSNTAGSAEINYDLTQSNLNKKISYGITSLSQHVQSLLYAVGHDNTKEINKYRHDIAEEIIAFERTVSDAVTNIDWESPIGRFKEIINFDDIDLTKLRDVSHIYNELRKAVDDNTNAFGSFIAAQTEANEERSRDEQSVKQEISSHRDNAEAIKQETAAEINLQKAKKKRSEPVFALKKAYNHRGELLPGVYNTPDSKYQVQKTDYGWRAHNLSGSFTDDLRTNTLTEMRQKLADLYNEQAIKSAEIKKASTETARLAFAEAEARLKAKEAAESEGKALEVIINKPSKSAKESADVFVSDIQNRSASIRDAGLELQTSTQIATAESARAEAKKKNIQLTEEEISQAKIQTFAQQQFNAELERQNKLQRLANERATLDHPAKQLASDIESVTKEAKALNIGQNFIDGLNQSAEKAKATVDNLYNEIMKLYARAGTTSAGKYDAKSMAKKIFQMEALGAKGFDISAYRGDLDVIKSEIGYDKLASGFDSNKRLSNTIESLSAPVEKLRLLVDALHNVIIDFNLQATKGAEEYKAAIEAETVAIAESTKAVENKSEAVKELKQAGNGGGSGNNKPPIDLPGSRPADYNPEKEGRRLAGRIAGNYFNLTKQSYDVVTGRFDDRNYISYSKLAQKVRDAEDKFEDLIAEFPDNEKLKDIKDYIDATKDEAARIFQHAVEQGELYADTNAILQGEKEVTAKLLDDMNDRAWFDAGKIHSQISQKETEKRAVDAATYLISHANEHFTNNALAKEDLYKGSVKTLSRNNDKWKIEEDILRPFLADLDSAPDSIRKKVEELLQSISRILHKSVPEAIDRERKLVEDVTANSLTNNSPLAKAYRAQGRLNNQKAENRYVALSAFQAEGKLFNVKNADRLSPDEYKKRLDDQAAELKNLQLRREAEQALINAYDGSNEKLKEQKQIYAEIQAEALKYAEARLAEANRDKDAPTKYDDQIRQAYDLFYRMQDLTQKRDTIGLTSMEIENLERVTNEYNTIRSQINGAKENTEEFAKAVEKLDNKTAQAKTKLEAKWENTLARRYGDKAEGTYRNIDDVNGFLQSVVTREGAKDFKLIPKGTNGDIQKFVAEITQADNSVEKYALTLNTARGNLYSMSKGVKEATSFFESFSVGLKKRAMSLVQYAMTFASLRTAIQAFRAAINNVKDLDSAFVELSRISHDSSAALEEFRKKSFEVADQVGSTAAQVINSAAQWEHLGYNVKEAGELAKVSSIYKNIADGMSSDSEATEDLVAIMKAYDFTAEQAIDVTDALIAVSNNYAVTAADIGNALKRSASAMSVANNTFEQNVALATAMAEVTQNAEKSGSALQVLSLRIRGAKTELQEMGEDTDDMASSTSKLRAQVKGLTKGFDIMADETTFKQTYDIMKGIAAVWDDLDDISRASLLETLAGKVRANQVAALLDNFSQAEKVLQTIAEDEGTAIANNEAKLNTIEARITKFKNATQHLTADIFQPELIKTVIDGGTKIVSILDILIQKSGALSPLFAVLGGATTAKGGGIIGGLNELRKKQQVAGKYKSGMFSDEQIEGITFLKDKGLLTKEKIELLQDYNEEQKNVLRLMAEKNLGMADAIKEVGESAQDGTKLFDLFREKGANAFKTVAFAAGNAAIGIGISLVLSTAIKLINEFLTYSQKLSESAKDFGAQLKSTNSDLDSYKAKIIEQRAIINDNKSSIEDVTTARSTLYELQKQMIDAYGTEKDAIKEISDAIDGQTDAIDRNIEKLKERQYRDAVDKYNEDNASIFTPVKQITDSEGNVLYTQKMDPYDVFLESMEQHQESLYKLANDVHPELQAVYNKHAKKNGWDDPSKVTGHVDQFIDFYDDYLDTLDVLYNSLDQQITEGQYKELENLVRSKRAPVKSTSENGRDLYNQEQLHQLRNGTYSDTYQLLNQLYADYTKAKTKETQDEIIHAYSDAINEVKNSGELSYGLTQALEALHPDLYAQAANWTFEVKIEADEDHLKESIKTALDKLKASNKGVDVTSDELRDWDKSKHTYEQNQAYENFAGIADSYDISFNELVSQSEKSAGLLSNELRDFNKFLNQTGIDIANFEKRVDTSTLSSTKNLKSKFETALKSVRGNYKNTTDAAVAAWKMVERAEERAADKTKDITGEQLMKIEGDLSKLKNDIFDSKGNVKNTTFKNKDFLAAFDNIPDHIDPAIKALDKFKKVVSTTTDKSEIQNAFDELATSYVYNLDEMKGLNEENAKYVEGALSQGGVVNAAEVVASALAKTRAETALSTIEDKLNTAGKLELTEANQVVSESTLETVNGLVAQTDAADGTQKMLANLLIQQMLLNGSVINTQESQEQLRALAQTAGYARGEIEGLIAAMALSSTLNSLGVSDAQKRRYTNAEGSERTNLINNRRNLEVKKTAKNINEALSAARMSGGSSGGTSGGSGGNSGGSNKEPSKTDKEWDWAARKAELLQRDNDRLREAVNSEYVILQDRKANIVDYNKAMEKLEDVKGQLTAMGVDVEGEEFQNLINTIDLSGAADDITSNVDSIEGEYAKIIDLSDEAAVKDFFGVSGEGEGAIDREIQLMAQYSKIMDELAETSDYASKTLDENGRGKLSIIEDLIESDKQQIEFYKQQKAQYAAEAEGYKEEILKAFDKDEALQWIKDIEEGNVNPEKWEQLSTYDSNDQKAKDKYESVDRMLKAKQREEEADDNIHKKMLQLVEDEQNRFQIQLNIVKAKQEEVQSLIDEAQHELDMKEILGEVVTESDYQHLIDLNDDLIASYREQISVLRDQADELDEGEGAWYDVQSQIRDCESAIRDAVKQQAEWNDTILRMPVENISRFLKLVQNLGQTLKNWLSVNDAKGIAQNAEQIQTSWTTAYDQIADDELGLMKQLEDYEELLENYDLGSSKFSEVDDEIQSARDSVEQLVEEMIELNKQLLTIPIDKLSEMTTYLDGTLSDLQSIQSEYETTINTVIDLITEQQENLEEEYNELEKSIEDQISPLEKQLEELQKANDARDRQLQIEQALLALETAREQKTVQVNYGLNLQ